MPQLAPSQRISLTESRSVHGVMIRVSAMLASWSHNLGAVYLSLQDGLSAEMNLLPIEKSTSSTRCSKTQATIPKNIASLNFRTSLLCGIAFSHWSVKTTGSFICGVSPRQTPICRTAANLSTPRAPIAQHDNEPIQACTFMR